MRIGFCGLGRMGVPMVSRLLSAGHEVHVWNRSPGPLRDVQAIGARVCASPCELGEQCAWVALCLFDAVAVRDVVFGADGLAQAGSLARKPQLARQQYSRRKTNDTTASDGITAPWPGL